jgi:hypothetical protein
VVDDSADREGGCALKMDLVLRVTPVIHDDDLLKARIQQAVKNPVEFLIRVQ